MIKIKEMFRKEEKNASNLLKIKKKFKKRESNKQIVLNKRLRLTIKNNKISKENLAIEVV